MSPAPKRIRTITLPSPFTSSESTGAPEPLSLHLSRKAASYLLVHSASGDTAPHQYSIINCLALSDPFPLPDEENRRCRMWLKIGPRASGEDGGENHGLVEHLEQQAIIREYVSYLHCSRVHVADDLIWALALLSLICGPVTPTCSTGIRSQQGEISQPLVELLLDEKELSHVCEGCGKFETATAESSSEDGEEEIVPAEDRFKRCGRCKMAYYCSSECQASHWKSHKSNCQDCIAETDYEIELARRQILLKVYGRADHLSEADEGQSAKKSKLD